MKRTRCPLAFLAAILFLSVPAAGSDPDPADIFDGLMVRRLIEILEDPALLTEWKLRGEAFVSLHRVVSEGGEPLVNECLTRIRTGEAEEIRRAQILLSLIDDLPEEDLAGLVEHPKIEVSAWARLRRGAPAGIETLDDPELYRVGSPPGRDPLLDVGDSIRDRLVLTDEELRATKPEFQEDYENVLLPRLENLADAIPEEERRTVDLDGDGVDELVVASNSLLHPWIHDFRFLAVIGREGLDSPWQIQQFVRLEDSEIVMNVIVTRIDPRAPPIVILACRLTGYSQTWPRLRVLRGDHDPLFLSTGSYGGLVKVLPAPAGGPPLFVTKGVHKLSIASTAVELVGACCFSVHVHRLEADGFQTVGQVFLPLDL